MIIMKIRNNVYGAPSTKAIPQNAWNKWLIIVIF